VLTWLLAILTFLCFAATLVLLIVGLRLNRNSLLLWGLLPLVLFFASFAAMMFSIFSSAFDAVGDFFHQEKKDGIVVYEELFGETEEDCVEVLKYKRFGPSFIPFAKWLHVETCPEEMERVASQMDPGIVKRSKEEVLPVHERFDMELEGDSILFYQKTGGGRISVYSNLERTEAYCTTRGK
jgi:hypothetical protein